MPQPTKNRGGKFAQNTALLMGGNILSQAISIALVPAITRIYSAEEFGEFSIIIATAMIVIPISCLRYDAAILLPDTRSDSKTLAQLSFGINCLLAMLLFALITPFHASIAGVIGINKSELLFLYPILVMLGGWQLIIGAWALRNKAFIAISVAGVCATTLDRFVGIASGLLTSIGTMGLLCGKLAGLAADICLIVIGLHKNRGHNNLPSNRIKEGIRLLRQYRTFAWYSGSAMIHQLGRQSPIFLLGIFYSPVTAGLYALCFRVLAEPVQIVGHALGRSFSQRAAEDKRNENDLSSITFKLFRYLLILIVVPMTILAIVAPDIFGFIFGEQWSDSGRYVQYVAPVFMLTFMLRSLGALFDVLRKQKEQFIFSLSMLAASGGSFMLGGLGYPVETILFVYAIAMVGVLGSRIIWFLRQVNIGMRPITRTISEIAISAAIFGLPVFYASNQLRGNDLAILFMAILAVVIYFAQCMYRDRYIRRQILGLFS